MEQALIISLNFNPGHVSHLMAGYKQFEELGYNSVYYIDKKFVSLLPEESEVYIQGRGGKKLCNVKVALFLFPSQYNLIEIIKLKVRFRELKIIYIFHEPMESLRIYSKSGFTSKMLFKALVTNMINTCVVWMSNVILLPSDKAIKLYDKKKYYLNRNRYYIPLMFDDESNENTQQIERKYFSYIGTIASDHSFKEFLNFVEWAINNSKLMSLNFMIASKNRLNRDTRIQKLISSGRLSLIDGSPLTNEQINKCYCSSYIVWNAYIRTTQSGVLVKSFMFGTPVIVLEKNISEFAVNGYEVVSIRYNYSFEEINKAVETILSDFSRYSNNCRQRFLNTFYYKNHNQIIEKIIRL